MSPRFDPMERYNRIQQALPRDCPTCHRPLVATPVSLWCGKCGSRYLPDKVGRLRML